VNSTAASNFKQTTKTTAPPSLPERPKYPLLLYYLRTKSIRLYHPKMALRPLSSAPNPSDFTPLQEHQEQTPSTFFGSKPVLYARYADLTLSLQTSKLQADPAIGKFAAEEDEGTEDSLVKGVEIWVSSE
jgi:hypothetical protein